MICGHCKTRGVSIEHVRTCIADLLDGNPWDAKIRAIGKPRTLSETGLTGVFSYEGRLFMVQRSLSTGKTYAKLWTATGWVYAGRSPLYLIPETARISAEQAAQFGHEQHRCVFCMRALTDERSTTVGYGPICADLNGLPWGEVAEAEVEA